MISSIDGAMGGWLSDAEGAVTKEAGDAVGRDGRWIEVGRRFAAPWQVVFRQWVTPDELARWFGPVGFTVSAFAVDPVEGGAYRLTLRAPSGDERTLTGHYLRVEPPSRLRFTWQPDGEVEVTEVDIRLRAEEGATRIRLRHGPFRDPVMAESHRRGWRSTLESLALQLTEDEPE